MALGGVQSRPRFVIAASLLCAFAAQQLYPGEVVYTALVCLVPFNALLALVLPERGVRYRAGYVWVLLLVYEGLLITAFPDGSRAARQHAAALAADAARRADLRRARRGDVARLARAHAAAGRERGRARPFYIAVEWVGSAHVYASFMAAAGAILIVALVQESHRLAFHDPLTGFPAAVRWKSA